MKKILIVTIFFIGTISNLEASLEDAWKTLKDGRGLVSYPRIIRDLVRGGFYHTASPYVKELLTSNRVRNTKPIDKEIDLVVSSIGVRQFEVLPISFLKKSNAPTVYYILAKKLFRKGEYKKSLRYIQKKDF